MQIKINDRNIGEGCFPFVVAELSGNHNGSIERAKEIILKAKSCGADAVKIQTFKPDSITLPCYKEEFIIKEGLWKGSNLYDLYQKTCLPYEWHQELFSYAKQLGITLFSSPFSEADVNFLEKFNVPAYKIASNELTHFPLIKEVLKTGKPVILSTGTATLQEVERTVEFLERHACRNYILLYCVSAYPTPLEEFNLSTMRVIKEQFGGLVGLSDHSSGMLAPIVAVAMGACLIEKHFTLDRNDGGSDSSFSIEPNELQQLCESVKLAYQSIGTPSFGYKDCEKLSPVFKRHYYAINKIEKGERFSLDNVSAVRSPIGISSSEYERVIGKLAARTINKYDPIVIEDISNAE